MKEQGKNGQNSVETSANEIKNAVKTAIENLHSELQLLVDSNAKVSKDTFESYKERYNDLLVPLKEQIEIGNLLAKVNANRIQN